MAYAFLTLDEENWWKGALDETTISQQKGYYIKIQAGHTKLTQYVVGKVPSQESEYTPELVVGWSLIGNVWPVNVDFDDSGLIESGANAGTPFNGDRIYYQTPYGGAMSYSWLRLVDPETEEKSWIGLSPEFKRGYGCYYKIDSSGSPFQWTNVKPYANPPY
jgi:hypothetical protein